MAIVGRILITALGLLVAAYLVPGIEVANLYTALIAALVLGISNLVVRPILIVLTLPVTIATLGLFIFVINAGLFLFVASFVDGFSVNGFFPALLGSLVVSIVSTIGQRFVS